MSNLQITFAVLALLSPIAIAPLIKKFFFDSRMRLRAEVRMSSAKTSQLIEKIVGDYVRVLPYDAEGTKAQIRTLVSFGDIKGYTSLRLRNISKKKLTNVSVMANDIHAMYQIDDGLELRSVEEGKALLVGDIAPSHERIVHFWSLGDHSDSHLGMKTRYRMSADELDSTSLRFPFPPYIRKRIIGWSIWALNIIAWGSFSAIILLKLLY
ncbi:hypothetical protein NKI86_16550 [Mesorhizobium sp. M0320]|uniref:hypothetical protein n=1 Tax=unclassified Mesorhizobium TaxID=325217 RepID=UPI0033374CBD